MLQAVGDHAHQPNAERHRRRPSLVHHAVQVSGFELGHVALGLSSDGSVIPDKPFRGDPNLDDRVRSVAVPDVPRWEVEAEPVVPAVAHPDLIESGHIGYVIVVHPALMPDQPADRVGLILRSPRQLFRAQPVDDFGDEPANASKCLEKEGSRVHAVTVMTPPRECPLDQSGVMETFSTASLRRRRACRAMTMPMTTAIAANGAHVR